MTLHELKRHICEALSFEAEELAYQNGKAVDITLLDHRLVAGQIHGLEKAIEIVESFGDEKA